MHENLKTVFEKQLKSEVKIESENQLNNAKTYFGRRITNSDKLLFAFVVERIVGTEIHMSMALLTERDFSDLNRKFSIDDKLTQKQMEASKSKYSVGMPVFVKNKILNEYLYLKGYQK